MFCYACRTFTHGEGKAEKVFTERGYRNWKHAQDALKHHDNCIVHKNAVLSWESYKNGSSSCTLVDHYLDSNGGDYSTERNGTERNDGLNHGTERFLKLKLATYHC